MLLYYLSSKPFFDLLLDFMWGVPVEKTMMFLPYSIAGLRHVHILSEFVGGSHSDKEALQKIKLSSAKKM